MTSRTRIGSTDAHTAKEDSSSLIQSMGTSGPNISIVTSMKAKSKLAGFRREERKADRKKKKNRECGKLENCMALPPVREKSTVQ